MRQHGPWKIKRSVVQYKNPWMEVREDQVIRPDRKKGIFGTVTVKNGVSVLPIDEQKNVYLTQEFHYKLGRYNIETVEGGTEKNESPLKTAQRELKEELGIEARTWISFGKAVALTSIVAHTQYLFVARHLSFGVSAREGTERITLVKIPFSRAVAMVMDGRILAEYTAILILKAARELKVL